MQTDMTKFGSRVEVSALTREDQGEDQAYDKIEQAVRILVDGGRSRILQEYKSSLIHILSEYALFAFRVYALIPPGKENVREPLEARVKGELDDFWSDA
jgi:hypothetical protein